jgi:signal transduction histidine kinase
MLLADSAADDGTGFAREILMGSASGVAQRAGQRLILLADDSASSRANLLEILLTLGAIEVIQAENGAEVVSMVEARRPDLVLCDYEMPILNGLQALQLLRRKWSPFELPVLMLTARKATNDKVAAFRFGANDYVTKPAQQDELLARVRAQLDLKAAVAENLAARMHLMQASKLQTVGRLAAGLAHEMNTPAQFVADNLYFVSRAMTSIQELLTPIRAWALDGAGSADELGRSTAAEWHKNKLDYFLEEVPTALAQSKKGIERIASLVSELRAFAAPDTQTRRPADLNAAINNMVAISRSEWQRCAELTLELDPLLPQVPCLVGELKQAFLNILDNATQSLNGAYGGEPRHGKIHITSRVVDGGVEIRFSDDGPGVDASIRDHIFDPFFTTKSVGAGTGQGLTVAHNVIADKHRGRLSYEPSPQGGASFKVWLPVSMLERTINAEDPSVDRPTIPGDAPAESQFPPT